MENVFAHLTVPLEHVGTRWNVGTYDPRSALNGPSRKKIGIALAGLGKLDYSLGDSFVRLIAPVRKAKGHTNHFKRDAHDTFGLRVERCAA
jgi:hypothetical protein